jgi:hypothetical protein
MAQTVSTSESGTALVAIAFRAVWWYVVGWPGAHSGNSGEILVPRSKFEIRNLHILFEIRNSKLEIRPPIASSQSRFSNFELPVSFYGERVS